VGNAVGDTNHVGEEASVRKLDDLDRELAELGIVEGDYPDEDEVEDEVEITMLADPERDPDEDHDDAR
jgi:hypothetical protein